MNKQSVYRFACVALCLASLVVLPRHACAQAVANAQITGQVNDPTGAAIVGATIKATETEKGVSHEATADADGRYTLPNLPVGPYRLEASMAGFKTYVQSGIVLQVGDHPQLDIQLQVGAVSENVEVTAGTAMVQTEQTSVSQVINQKSIVELPLNGRQPTQLVLISGAAVVTPPGDTATSKNYFSSTTISVGGGQANGTNYLLDGHIIVKPFIFADKSRPFADFNAVIRLVNLQIKDSARAGCRAHHTEQHLDCAAFTRPVLTEEAAD